MKISSVYDGMKLTIHRSHNAKIYSQVNGMFMKSSAPQCTVYVNNYMYPLLIKYNQHFEADGVKHSAAAGGTSRECRIKILHLILASPLVNITLAESIPFYNSERIPLCTLTLIKEIRICCGPPSKSFQCEILKKFLKEQLASKCK